MLRKFSQFFSSIVGIVENYDNHYYFSLNTIEAKKWKRRKIETYLIILIYSVFAEHHARSSYTKHYNKWLCRLNPVAICWIFSKNHNKKHKILLCFCFYSNCFRFFLVKNCTFLVLSYFLMATVWRVWRTWLKFL